jgi:hypothetical protein
VEVFVMGNFDWKGLVRTVAPSIATAFGGPLAGMAAQAVSNAILGKPDGTEEEISMALATAKPETLLALKKAEYEFQKFAKEAEIDLERIGAEDRASARKREIAVKDKAPGRLAFASFAGFFGILALLIFIEIPETGRDPLLIMLGALGSIVTGITQYYYGSSSGSDKKNDMLVGILKK